MVTEIFIDPYTLTNPPLEAGAEKYLQFIENLFDWEKVFYEENVTTFLHSEIIEALFLLDLYPLHNTLKASHTNFDIQHISIDSVNKIVTSFINKSKIFECEFEFVAIAKNPDHHEAGSQGVLDNILNNIFGYMVLNSSYCISQGLFSNFFNKDATNITASITNGICSIPITYPTSTTQEIQIFKQYTYTVERCLLVKIPETEISPTDKKIKLSGTHHGNKLLKKFAKKLFQSPYIISVINNSDFVPTAKSIINEVYENGQIHIVLSTTDEGFSMVIQTTGTNLFETQRIADIIHSRFNDKQ